MKLYITADRVGEQSGGGLVTSQEAAALLHITEPPEKFSVCSPSQKERDTASGDPFVMDRIILEKVKQTLQECGEEVTLAHCYSGCLTRTVEYLKSRSIPVTYTAAAHDVGLSRQEHESLGISYDLPHITNPELWSQYVRGYLLADRLIVPSIHSAEVMRGFGADPDRIRRIPHGVTIPQEEVAEFPALFTVGYLGAIGPDKGLKYLLQAWKHLNYNDAVLVLAGRYSNHPFMDQLIGKFGGGCIYQLGWVDKITDFYNRISLYIQPSVTEGFGCEVLEAMAHGRPVLCSTGAGANDCVPHQFCFKAGDVGALVQAIKLFRGGNTREPFPLEENGNCWRQRAQLFSWEEVHKDYLSVWRGLLTRS